MAYRLVADTAMVLHMAFLVYVVLGGFIAWRWPRTFWIHLGVALYAFGIVLIGWECPLTHVERWGRDRAGQEGLPPTGFIDHYLTGVVYPEEHLGTVRLAAALLILLTWTVLAVRGAHRLHRT
ncbi:DUF2784 domain-containing protein [Nocardiopsis lambiniae]|uniref:DUF2784 domain-containing protein n=1 Tax=Nocardiopsis lambiniae TaxID=3075539 RepID=A0ABU2MDY3_9ACTN|nr:DUF2784 domain-containing protein [Nocardiopsis sp. DSM 44743]MDT0330491.1 DUF2784 domain-containing protein [Nocardiopsis sp. DSM 44743]